MLRSGARAEVLMSAIRAFVDLTDGVKSVCALIFSSGDLLGALDKKHYHNKVRVQVTEVFLKVKNKITLLSLR